MLALPVKDDVQVLDVEVFELDTVLPVKALLEDCSVGVDVIEDVVSIFLLACGKDDDLVPLGQLFEYVLNVWAQAHLNLGVPEVERKGSLEAGRDKAFKFGGNERLIHIEDQ